MKTNLALITAVSAQLLANASFSAPPPCLPPHLAAVREEVIRIASANTLRRDNIPAVRAELAPRVDALATWFNANRPSDEVALTQRSWKSLWYDDPTIDDFSYMKLGPVEFGIDRNGVYQVVKDGYYYNVTDIVLKVAGVPLRMAGFLKGAYTLARVADGSNAGQPRLNTVDLEFVANSVRLGRIPRDKTLDQVVAGVEQGQIRTIPTPGPIGVTGELWNLYIDEDLRISAGFEDDKQDVIDLYILRAADRAGS